MPYAPPGTRPPAMDERLGVKTIRGHKSPGMLCSAIELGVGENADGILILEEGDARTGARRGARPRHRPRPRRDHEPAGLPLPRRDRARAGRGARRDPERAAGGGAGRAALGDLGRASGERSHRGPAGLPPVRGPGDRGHRCRPVAALVAQPAPVRRAAADQQRRRHHQLHHPRARPADARLRPRPVRRGRRHRSQPRWSYAVPQPASTWWTCSAPTASCPARTWWSAADRARRASPGSSAGAPPRSPTRPGPCSSRRRRGTGRRSARRRSGSGCAPTRRPCSRRG